MTLILNSNPLTLSLSKGQSVPTTKFERDACKGFVGLSLSGGVVL